MARLTCCDVAEQVGNYALRQVVSLDLIADGKRLQFGHKAPVPPDHALHEARVTEVIEAAFLAVALTGRVNERQVARTSDTVWIILCRIHEAVLERDSDVLGETYADEA